MRIDNLAKKRALILPIFSGFLLVLSFPKWELSYLAWIALVPLFFSMEKKSPKESFFLGFLFGMVFFLGTMYWLSFTMKVYGHLSILTSTLFLILLTAYLALYPAIFCWTLGHLRETLMIDEWVMAPFVWSSLEFIRNYFLSGLPWVLIGYSQYRTIPIIQIADLTGIYGIGFLIIMANSSIYILMKAPFSIEKKKWVIYPILVSILMGVTFLYGILRIDHVDLQSREGKWIKVGIAQGNIPQEIKWSTEFQERTIEIYRNLTMIIAKEKPDIVIWPETSAPFFFQSDEKYRSKILETVRRVNVDLIFGSPAFRKNGKDMELFNRAYLISDGEVSGYYDKVHLVPFGEYVPMRRFLPFIHRMVQSIGDFSPGKKKDPVRWRKGISLGILICFESIFPELSREFVSKGARILVNITNDAWFGKTSAPYQHLAMLTIRAVENRVSIARSANTGISATIDPTGRIRKTTGLFVREIMIDNISIQGLKSFYTRYGDIFSYLCLGIYLFLVLLIIFAIFNGGKKWRRLHGPG